jgi:hypothetical protein
MHVIRLSNNAWISRGKEKSFDCMHSLSYSASCTASMHQEVFPLSGPKIHRVWRARKPFEMKVLVSAIKESAAQNGNALG